MKIVVFSDSHGTISDVVEVALAEHPDKILFLGDCWGGLRAFYVCGTGHPGGGGPRQLRLPAHRAVGTAD